MAGEYRDYLVVGAGPAGLQIGYYLQKNQRQFTILESEPHVGAFFSTYPRHRKLISINKIYTGYQDPEINLRWDWNSLLEEDESEPLRFTQFSKKYFPDAQDLLNYTQAFSLKHGLPIEYNTQVQRIERENGLFVVHTNQGVWTTRVLIMASGVSREYLPNIEGIEAVERYSSVSIEPDDFKNQRVLILGKGNSAFETADNLVDTAAMIHVSSPHSLRMAWSTHYVGHLRAVNNNLLDTYQLKSQNAILDADVKSIVKTQTGFRVSFEYQHAEGEVEEIHYDRVIACTGFAFNSTLFAPNCMPSLCINGRFPEQDATWQSTNIENLYFVGTLMQMRDFKKYMSGFIHGFRYNIRTLSRVLEARFHGVPYPQAVCDFSVSAMSDHMLSRINRSSALWQQPGFLCDVLLIDRAQQSVRYLEELTPELAKQRFPETDEYLTVSLEFGARKHADPFSVERIARDNVHAARDSNFLHPVIRHFSKHGLLSEHHVIEDLAAEWREPEHIEPLQMWLQNLVDLDGVSLVSAA